MARAEAKSVRMDVSCMTFFVLNLVSSGEVKFSVSVRKAGFI